MLCSEDIIKRIKQRRSKESNSNMYKKTLKDVQYNSNAQKKGSDKIKVRIQKVIYIHEKHHIKSLK